MTDFFLKKSFSWGANFVGPIYGVVVLYEEGEWLIIRSCQGEGSFTNTINLRQLVRYTLEEKTLASL